LNGLCEEEEIHDGRFDNLSWLTLAIAQTDKKRQTMEAWMLHV
jgi:hypothetical protein